MKTVKNILLAGWAIWLFALVVGFILFSTVLRTDPGDISGVIMPLVFYVVWAALAAILLIATMVTVARAQRR